MAFQQLLLILATIYFAAGSLFATVTILSGPVGDTKDELTMIAVVSISAIQTMARLYFKIRVAVGITREVHIFCFQLSSCMTNYVEKLFSLLHVQESRVSDMIKKRELGDQRVAVDVSTSQSTVIFISIILYVLTLVSTFITN